MKTDVFKKSKWCWGTNLLSLAFLQEKCKLVSQSCISRRAGEGGWILGASFCFNRKGWFWIKCRGAVQSLHRLGRAAASERVLPFSATCGGLRA